MRNRVLPYNPALKDLARKLRIRCTGGELMLWEKIRRRSLGVEFHRQVPIDNYIVDFYCHEIMLAIEIDGCSHDEETVQKNDIYRQDKLEGLGVQFIRFDDIAVKKNVDLIVAQLAKKIDEVKEIRRVEEEQETAQMRQR